MVARSTAELYTRGLAAGDHVVLEVLIPKETYERVGIINWTTKMRAFRYIFAPNDTAKLAERNTE